MSCHIVIKKSSKKFGGSEYMLYIYSMKDTEGLKYYKWSEFDCPLEKGSAYKFMERLPVLLLDSYVTKTRYNIEVLEAYMSPKYADKHKPSRSSHRVGHAIRVKITAPDKRMKFVSYLIHQGVRRIGFDNESVYYDTDDLKRPMLTYDFVG